MKYLVAILLLTGSGSAYCQDQLGATNDMTAEILEVNRDMERTFNKREYAKVGEYYAAKGVMVGNKVEVVGQDNLIAYWGKFGNAHEWVLENTQITILGPDAALQRGYSNIYYYKDGELAVSRSIFSLVWVKTSDGWRILLDHFSPR